MSITDELRKWLKSLYTPNSGTVKDEGERIADRIDAEHEKQMAERRRSCVFYDAERNYCKVHDEGDMAELGWVRKEEGKTISACYVDVVPRFDWKLMALELEQFAEIVRGMAGDDK